MKKINILLVGISVLLLTSCKQEAVKPKVTYDATKGKVKSRLDTTQIEVADLPIQMEGTNYLIHPVGDLSISEGRTKSSYGSTSADRLSFTISNTSEFEITGYLRNLKFQEIGSDSIKKLTDKPVLIQTATYLKTVADKTKQQIMVYTMADRDTNKDGKLDTSDIKALYISEISGKKLMKLSPELQDLIDWNLVESKNRLYFRTIEDANKNGQFDKNDILYYHFVDLSNQGWIVMDYKPV
ncbi:MAG: hypothetical protein ABWZ56_07705 [Flavobacterium sp.]